MNDEYRIMNYEVSKYEKSLHRSKGPCPIQHSIFDVQCSMFDICLDYFNPEGLHIYSIYRFAMLYDLVEVERHKPIYLSINI